MKFMESRVNAGHVNGPPSIGFSRGVGVGLLQDFKEQRYTHMLAETNIYKLSEINIFLQVCTVII